MAASSLDRQHERSASGQPITRTMPELMCGFSNADRLARASTAIRQAAALARGRQASEKLTELAEAIPENLTIEIGNNIEVQRRLPTTR
jgi:hypothetical protein